jgi:7-keto-8-aminopelargonate synthetase-like enzyme
MSKTSDIEGKRRRALELLRSRKQQGHSEARALVDDYRNYTYDMFMHSDGAEPVECRKFSHWVESASADKVYAFESVRTSMQTSEVDLVRETGEAMHLLNFSSYNYLGLGYHPEVIRAAQDAVARFGLGANSSPVISGTYEIHKELEDGLLRFFSLPDHGISLFTSGYGVNLGVIQAFVKPGGFVVCDRHAHMSILDGAKLSGAQIRYFEHNDAAELDSVLEEICGGRTRVLVCAEGVYSSDGDYGKLKVLVSTAKKHGAFVLVDEAHSALLAGETGRGVCEQHGILEDVDLYVMTFSKALAGVGGALLAHKDIVRYVNWYAKCRMFSCALDPAVTGGMIKALEIASGPEGRARRDRLRDNVSYFRGLLLGKVNLGRSETWIMTVIYGNDTETLNLNDYLQRQGLDASIMQFPAAPKNEGRIRLFVTSEHTHEQLDRAAAIILGAADRFGFSNEYSV